MSRPSRNLDDLPSLLRDGDAIVWPQTNGQPRLLTDALVAQRQHFKKLRVFLGVNQSPVPGVEHADVFEYTAYCGAGHNRALLKAGVLDILPCHYSELPGMIRRGVLPVDVVMLQVSPPDDQGRYSLGLANEYLFAALDRARVVLAEVNSNVPWTHSTRHLTIDEFDLLVEADTPLTEMARSAPNEVEQAIGRHVAALIEDGATIQLGLGGIPEAVMNALGNHRDLGVHSGTIGDGVATLMEAGVVTNAHKEIDTGVTVTGILMGSMRLARFAHRNPLMQMRGTEYTHSARVLGNFRKFVAINSAIEVDLTGQVNAEVAGGVYVGAVGGALDFTRAAQAAERGVPVLALPSTAGKNSRIVATIAGVVSTPRSDAGVIVTEYGVADLRGLSMSARIARMLAIAHPDHRAALERDAFTLIQGQRQRVA